MQLEPLAAALAALKERALTSEELSSLRRELSPEKMEALIQRLSGDRASRKIVKQLYKLQNVLFSETLSREHKVRKSKMTRDPITGRKSHGTAGVDFAAYRNISKNQGKRAPK